MLETIEKVNYNSLEYTFLLVLSIMDDTWYDSIISGNKDIYSYFIHKRRFMDL